ncbi:MAG: M20/M25/M40 family metallo-hydrolase [Nocardioidaceae bacterium]|nr:M20/M25/M40 family metallo-hydrolase [Nocardioidaceae bacterium]
MTDAQQTPSYDPTAEVVRICQELIRIDTQNFGDGSGPGERKAAEYVAASLDEVGIESTLVESAPGRASVVARWGDHSGDEPPLLLHGHLDVVPAQAADWSQDPFGGELVDGYLYGRGAVDMKDFDAMVLSVVRARQRAGVPPRRPVVLAFTADEEAGSTYGAHHLVDEHPDLFEGVTEAVGEVGGYSVEVGGKRLYLVESGEKGISWMRLTVDGTAGHGSMRHPDNAVVALAEAVARLGRHEWPDEPGPSMQLLLDKVAELSGIDRQHTSALMEQFGPAARMVGAGMRNTTNPTMLSAGYKVNVVPGTAQAHVDGRYLPGHQDSFMAAVQDVLGDRVRAEPETFQPALEIGFEGDLVDAMTMALHTQDPEAHIAPYLMSGGTDAKAWDRLGIRSYGFTPLRLPADLDFTALFHGIDERVPTDALEFGCKVLDSLVDLA